MSDPAIDRVLRRYIEECGTFCPLCSQTWDPVRRRAWTARLARSEDGEQARLHISCYCNMCGGDWIEVYRLESVELVPPEREETR
jgi:hypothetical protein